MLTHSWVEPVAMTSLLCIRISRFVRMLFIAAYIVSTRHNCALVTKYFLENEEWLVWPIPLPPEPNRSKFSDGAKHCLLFKW